MSLHSVGSDTKYILPASMDQVPEAFRSNRSAKPIPCSLQTVNIPSLSGSQALGGSSVIQVPCGASAGILMNPYVRFTVRFTSGAGVANSSFVFKGASRAATACMNSISTYVNSVQVDNQQSVFALYDTLFQHSTSNDWLSHDGTLMVGAGVRYYQTAAGDTTSQDMTFCVPLLGLLGSQQAMPLYLINGTLQIQINWASTAAACYTYLGADPAWTGASFSNVQLVFDRIQPEQAFVDKVRSDMMQGHKYVYGYTNYSTTFLNIPGAGAQNLNYGLNVSSLRGVLAVQYATAALASSADAPAIANNLTSFQLSCDGRLMNTVILDSTTTPALCFAELQKTMGRIYDSSISDTLVNAQAAPAGAGVVANSQGGTFLTNSFAVGVSAQRVNEALAFSGTPTSVASLQMIIAGNTGAINTVATTMYVIFISDFQILVDASGSIEIVR